MAPAYTTTLQPSIRKSGKFTQARQFGDTKFFVDRVIKCGVEDNPAGNDIQTVAG